MMTIKPTELLPPLYPVDAVAARVVFQKGEQWAPSIRGDSTSYRSEIAPPKLRPVNRGDIDLTGLVVGRLTVLGLSAEVKSGNQRASKGARWAVRCSCGAYEHRSAKALKAAQAKTNQNRAMCDHCDYTEQMKQGHKTGLLERERQIKQKEIAQAEAINNSKAVRSFVQKYANAKRPQR